MQHVSSNDVCSCLLAEALFTQLEQVLVALLRVTYPTSISPARGTGTSISANTSTSSSRPAVPLQEVAALALAWEQVCYLLTSFAVAAEPVVGGCGSRRQGTGC